MKKKLSLIILCTFLFLWMCSYYQKDSLSNNLQQNTKVVEIKGYVKNPGIYELAWDATIEDLLEKAGGVLENGNLDHLALHKNLENGDVVVIGKQEEKCISLNSASKEQLKQLPRIGETIAQRIIDYRQHSSFTTIEQIKEVKGIGEKTFDKMKEFLCL